MSRKKRFIKDLTVDQKAALTAGYKKGNSHSYRIKCHCLLLSHEGQSVPQLVDLFKVSQVTIYSWFNRWEAEGIEGLPIRDGRGRKRKLDIDNEHHVKEVKQSLKKENRNLNTLQADVESNLEQKVSKVTLRRFLKKLVSDTNDSENA